LEDNRRPKQNNCKRDSISYELILKKEQEKRGNNTVIMLFFTLTSPPKKKENKQLIFKITQKHRFKIFRALPSQLLKFPMPIFDRQYRPFSYFRAT